MATGPLMRSTVGGGPAAVQPAAGRRDWWRRSRGTAWADSRAASGRSAMGILRTPIRAVGRVGLAAMFITGGADAMLAPGPRTAKAAELGVPFDPELAVRINGAAMLAAGVALAPGLWPCLAAGVLAGTLVPTTLAGHPYWQLDDPPPAASSGPISSRTSACSAAPCWCSASRAGDRPQATRGRLPDLGRAADPRGHGAGAFDNLPGAGKPSKTWTSPTTSCGGSSRSCAARTCRTCRRPSPCAKRPRTRWSRRPRPARRPRCGGSWPTSTAESSTATARRPPVPAQPGPFDPERVVRSWRERQQR